MSKKSLVLTLLLSVVLAACQSGTATQKLNVELSDFAIAPNQFTVQAGSEVTVRVSNKGTIEHDLNIMNFGTDIGDKFDDKDRVNVLWEVNLQPGETKSGTFTVPDEPGTYQVVCGMPGHMEAGMIGTLEVVDK